MLANMGYNTVNRGLRLVVLSEPLAKFLRNLEERCGEDLLSSRHTCLPCRPLAEIDTLDSIHCIERPFRHGLCCPLENTPWDPIMLHLHVFTFFLALALFLSQHAQCLISH